MSKEPAAITTDPDPTGNSSEIRILVRLTIVLVIVALVVLIAPILASFADLATIFFLAWLLAFLIRPLAVRLSGLFGAMPYGAAVGLAYVVVGLAAAVVIASVAVSVAQSIIQLATSSTSLSEELGARLAPLQAQLDAAGLGGVRPVDWISGAVETVDLGSQQALDAFGTIAVSLAGALGTLSIVVFMSVYIAADRDRLLAGVRRTVPIRHRGVLEISHNAIGHSFGGFIRGQVVMGIMYGVVAVVACLVLGLPYAPLVGVTVAILQTIPYFGQFVSWAPPVLVAVLFVPGAAIPALIIMVIGLIVLANLVQPRVLGTAVGLSPLAVLVAVLIGGRVAGVLGAVFAVPVSAAGLAIIQQVRSGTPGQENAVESASGDAVEDDDSSAQTNPSLET